MPPGFFFRVVLYIQAWGNGAHVTRECLAGVRHSRSKFLDSERNSEKEARNPCTYSPQAVGQCLSCAQVEWDSAKPDENRAGNLKISSQVSAACCTEKTEVRIEALPKRRCISKHYKILVKTSEGECHSSKGSLQEIRSNKVKKLTVWP